MDESWAKAVWSKVIILDSHFTAGSYVIKSFPLLTEQLFTLYSIEAFGIDTSSHWLFCFVGREVIIICSPNSLILLWPSKDF